MKSTCVALSLMGSVMGFGGVGDAPNACEQCICDHDQGEYEDPTDKKCCASMGASVDEWDGFCDGVALLLCKDECTDEVGHANLALLPHLAMLKPRLGDRGDVCDRRTFEKNDHPDDENDHAKCGPGLFCHKPSPDSDIRVCATLDSALYNLADKEEGDALLADLTPEDRRDAVFGFLNENLSEEEKDALLIKVADRLGVDPAELSHSEDMPSRRQFQNFYGYPVYHQPSGYPSSSSSHHSGCPSSNSACSPLSPSQASAYTTKIENMGVSLMCWDWDLTANTLHTYQQEYDSYKQLEDATSRQFIAVADQWCKEGKNQAICTYSNPQAYSKVGGRMVSGTDMIAHVLDKVLAPGCGKKMPIFGRNDSGKPNAGKTWHLQQAQQRFGVWANKEEMLVDDTADNVNVALSQGYQTIFVTPNKGFSTLTGQFNSRATSSKGSW